MEPWIIGFIRRLALVSLASFSAVVIAWISVSLIVATFIAVAVDGWPIGERIALGLFVFATLDLIGGLALLVLVTIGRGVFWLFTGRWLALR
jgi:hypothetical protein